MASLCLEEGVDIFAKKPKSLDWGDILPILGKEALLHLLLILKIQYPLSYRALEGFSKSLLPLILCDLSTSSLIYRRFWSQSVWRGGMESEKARASGGRKWLKLHLTVDPTTQEII